MYEPGSAFTLNSKFRLPTRPNHYGVDFRAPVGTPIPAAAAGVVWYSGFHRDYGNIVILRHAGADGAPFFTLYAHMDGEIMPSVGADVQSGETVGLVGNTGRSFGPHLRFEIIDGDTALNRSGALGVTPDKGRIDPEKFYNWPRAC